MKTKGKCLIAALVVCLLVQIAMPLGALAAGSSYSLVDIVRAARSLSGSGNLTVEQQLSYDLNGDGRFNILDLTLLAEAVLASAGQVVPEQRVICDDCGQYPCVCKTNVAAPAPQPTICPDCGHYPCVCNTYMSAAQPTICPNCSHYPCVCNSYVAPQPTVCGQCHHYPCSCGSGSGSSVSSGSSWTCGTCHSNPCVCSGSGSGHHSSSGSHHGYGHH